MPVAASPRFRPAVARRNASGDARDRVIDALARKWIAAIRDGALEQWPAVLARAWRDDDGVDWAAFAEADLDADIAAWRAAAVVEPTDEAFDTLEHMARLRAVVGAFYAPASRAGLGPETIGTRP